MIAPGTVVNLPQRGVVYTEGPMRVYLCPEHKPLHAQAVLQSASQSRLAGALGVETYQCIKCGARYAVPPLKGDHSPSA